MASGDAVVTANEYRSDNAEDEKSSDENVIREEVRRCSIDTAPEMENGPAGRDSRDSDG